MADAQQLDLPAPDYPNSPLAFVVFEIRFPGEPAIECHRDEFFEIAREEFPQVFVPKLQAGEAVALSPYHFKKEDGSASLLTGLNLFAYHTLAYPGFPRFRAEALLWVEKFAATFKIGRLTRTGLRYMNVIPYTPTERFPVSSFFDINMRLGVIESSTFSKFSLSAVIPTSSGGNLTVQIHEVQEERGVDAAISLDFDFAMAGDLHVSDIARYLDDSHDETRRLFEGLLTEQYRNFLRGEALG